MKGHRRAEIMLAHACANSKDCVFWIWSQNQLGYGLKDMQYKGYKSLAIMYITAWQKTLKDDGLSDAEVVPGNITIMPHGEKEVYRFYKHHYDKFVFDYGNENITRPGNIGSAYLSIRNIPAQQSGKVSTYAKIIQAHHELPAPPKTEYGKLASYYASEWWQFMKNLIHDIRGERCQLCGIEKHNFQGLFHVHHSVYNLHEELPEDLLLLCESCHTNHHKYRNNVDVKAFDLKRFDPLIHHLSMASAVADAIVHDMTGKKPTTFRNGKTYGAPPPPTFDDDF